MGIALSVKQQKKWPGAPKYRAIIKNKLKFKKKRP